MNKLVINFCPISVSSTHKAKLERHQVSKRPIEQDLINPVKGSFSNNSFWFETATFNAQTTCFHRRTPNSRGNFRFSRSRLRHRLSVYWIFTRYSRSHYPSRIETVSSLRKAAVLQMDLCIVSRPKMTAATVTSLDSPKLQFRRGRGWVLEEVRCWRFSIIVIYKLICLERMIDGMGF